MPRCQCGRRRTVAWGRRRASAHSVFTPPLALPLALILSLSALLEVGRAGLDTEPALKVCTAFQAFNLEKLEALEALHAAFPVVGTLTVTAKINDSTSTAATRAASKRSQ